jgi:hypothetical protein
MMDQLELATLHRTGATNPLRRERYTFDFVVNGVSLFEATQASIYDMCGCLSDPRLEPELAGRINDKSVNLLTSEVRLGVGHRTVLFGCPECGDLACGAITVFVSRNELLMQWSDFAYENGYEAKTAIADIGPFAFDWAAYVAAFPRTSAD